MTLNILTLVLNGMPFLPKLLPVFESLGIPWRWSIAHGPAANVNCSRWCAKQIGGLSTDGTKEWLQELKGHPNVTIKEQAWWQGGKVQMCREATAAFKAPGVLLQNDVDETWTATQIRNIVRLFEINKKAQMAAFKCRFWCGPDIAIIPATDPRNRWLRAWRFTAGMQWRSHEPPNLNGNRGECVSEHDTERLGLTFEHYSLVTEAQAAYKEEFYKQNGLVNGWRRLQSEAAFPVKLGHYFPWMGNQVMAERVNPSSLPQSCHSGALPVERLKAPPSPDPAPSAPPAAAVQAGAPVQRVSAR